MPDRLCLLHIGVTKTGTSSIQAWLAGRREALAARGIHLPVSVGRQNHARLADIALDHAAPEEAAAFAAEMRALPPSIHTIAFTSEYFGAQLGTAARVARLKALLDPHVGGYRICVYLRRQDEHRVSSFSTAMRAGMLRRSAPLSAPPLDYEALLDAWAGVFGRAALRPRVFARGALKDDDVVADFLEASGIGAVPGDAAPVERNASLLARAQVFLARLAAHAQATGAAAGGEFRAIPGRAALIEALDAHFAGPGLLPSRAEAMAYYDACRASNERVRAAWFPERATLFPEDFSRYPEAPTPVPGSEDLLEVAMTTVLALMAATDPGAHARERHRKLGAGRAPTQRPPVLPGPSARAGDEAREARRAARRAARRPGEPRSQP